MQTQATMTGHGRTRWEEMNNKAYDLAHYSFAKGERILLDANIWIYLFPAPSGTKYKYAYQYSSAFDKLIMAGAQPIIDPIVLSEYLNRYCRIEYDASYNLKYEKYKEFRQSSDFAAVAETAECFAMKILKCCRVHSLPTNNLDLRRALAEFKSGKIDFNDCLLVDICKKENLKLMTNDKDFQRMDIEILTSNPNLLKAYS